MVIVLLNVNEFHGKALADVLMPGQDALWDEIRARGETPFARGLAARESITELVTDLDAETGARLKNMGTAVVVMDFQAVEAFEA